MIIRGDLYTEALEKAKAVVAANPNAYVLCIPGVPTEFDPHNARRILVPANDSQVLRNGHASMICEIKDMLDFILDVIFCSAARGGLLEGVINGCASVGWGHATII